MFGQKRNAQGAVIIRRGGGIHTVRGRTAGSSNESRMSHINPSSFLATGDVHQFPSDNEDTNYEYDSETVKLEQSDEPAFEEVSLGDMCKPAANVPFFDIDDMVYSIRSLENRMTTMEKNMLKLSTEVKTMFQTLVTQISTIAKGMQAITPSLASLQQPQPRQNSLPRPPSTQVRPMPSEPTNEDFTAYRKIKLRTSEELEHFEQQLEDSDFRRNLTGYLKKRFSSESKSPKEMFVTIIRELTDTELFLPYSWKGSRRAGEVTPSFLVIHERFVSFIRAHIVGRFGGVTEEDIDKWFEKSVMRMKNENHARELERRASGRIMRETCTRVRAPKAKWPKGDDVDAERWDDEEAMSETMHGDEDAEGDPFSIC